MASKKSSVISVLIKGDSSQFSSAVDDANGRLGKLGSAAGLAAKAVGAAALAIGAVAVREFAKFDSAMQKSVAIMGDVSDTLRNDMADAAREVAKTTTFSAEQAAESFFFLASAGLDATASVAALPKVAAFAQAGMFDMALATDLLTDAQSALGLAIRDDGVANMQQMVRVSDVLVKANTLANATVQQFSEALTNKAGASMRSLNIDMEEGVAVLAVFADQGIKGSQAGTTFNATIRGLTQGVQKNADEFRRLGIEVFDSSGALNSMAGIVGQMETALGGMSVEQQRAELSSLGFTEETLAGTLALIGNSEAIAEYERQLRIAAGTTDEIATKQLGTFVNQLGLLKSIFQDVAIEIGSVLVPVLGGLVSFLQDKGPQISAFAENAGEKIGAFIEFVGGKATEFKTFFDERLREPVDAVREAIGTFVDFASGKLGEFAGAVPGAVKAFTDFIAEVRGLADDPQALGRRLGDALVNAFVVALDQVSTLAGRLGEAFKQLIQRVDFFAIGANSVAALILFGLGFVTAVLDFSTWLGPVLTAIRNNLPTILFAALTIALAPAAVAGRVAKILGKIPLAGRFIAFVVTALNRMGAAMRDRIVLVFQSFGQGFSNAIANLGPGIIARFVTFIRAIPQALTRMFDDLALGAASGFARFGTAVANAIVNLVTKFRELLSFLLKPFTNFGKTLIADLRLVGRMAIDALVKGIGSMAGVLGRAVSSMARSVIDGFKNVLKIKSPSKAFMGIGKDAMEGLALGLSGSERMLRELSTGVGNSVLPSINVGSGGAGTVINLNVTGAIDPEATARVIIKTLDDAQRRTGVRIGV